MRLDGKTALITGAGQGIGQAIAYAMRSEGARIIIFDINGNNDLNGDFEFYRVDIRDDRQIMEAVRNIERVDILVNNAGIYFEKHLEDTDNGDLDRMVDTNIKGTFMMTRNLIGKIKTSNGCIINVASCLGLVPEPTSPLYCATKAGIIMLTKSLAQQYADIGVRVNCVLPGPTDTQLLQNSFTCADSEEKCGARIPMRRIGKPEEVANVAVFLASSEASYITGGVYAVDGGVSSSSIYSK